MVKLFKNKDFRQCSCIICYVKTKMPFFPKSPLDYPFYGLFLIYFLQIQKWDYTTSVSLRVKCRVKRHFLSRPGSYYRYRFEREPILREVRLLLQNIIILHAWLSAGYSCIRVVRVAFENHVIKRQWIVRRWTFSRSMILRREN